MTKTKRELIDMLERDLSPDDALIYLGFENNAQFEIDALEINCAFEKPSIVIWAGLPRDLTRNS